MTTVCTDRKSKAHPNVYTKEQLIKKIGLKDYKKSELNKMTKKDLCKIVGITYIETKKSKAVKTPKVKTLEKSPIKTKTPKVVKSTIKNVDKDARNELLKIINN